MQKHEINGYPTIKLFLDSSNPIVYDGERNEDSIVGFLKKHIKNYQEINSKRGLRYFGPSKMSLFKLGIHSFAIIAVFKYSVYLRSLLLITCLFFSKNILGVYWVVMSLILITFNICIFLVSLREDQKALENSENNVKSIISL